MGVFNCNLFLLIWLLDFYLKVLQQLVVVAGFLVICCLIYFLVVHRQILPKVDNGEIIQGAIFKGF